MPSEPTLGTIVREQRPVLAVLLGVVLLGVANWILSPHEAVRSLRAMLTLPTLWLALTLWRWSSLRSLRQHGDDDLPARMRYSGSVVALAFLPLGVWQMLMLALRMWVRLADHRGDLDFERRILGLAASVVLVVIGNALPKILTPLSMLPRERAQLVTVARRFVGTTLVLFGSTTALAFVSAPLTVARTLMQWAAGAVLLATIGAIVWMNTTPVRRGG